MTDVYRLMISLAARLTCAPEDPISNVVVYERGTRLAYQNIANEHADIDIRLLLLLIIRKKSALG